MTGNSQVSINDLLALQARFMVVLGIDPSSGTLIACNKPSESERGAAIGIVCEAAEILEVVDKANRVWKNFDNTAADLVKEELIDVIFFTLELLVLLNLNGEQVATLYLEKYKKNLLRYLNATATKSGGVNSQLVLVMDEVFGYAETEKLIKEALEKKET